MFRVLPRGDANLPELAIPRGIAGTGEKPATETKQGAKTAAETSLRAALERSHRGVVFGDK